VTDIVAAKHALELQRQNDISVQDGDYRDEHAGGFGDRLVGIAGAVGEVAAALRESGGT